MRPRGEDRRLRTQPAASERARSVHPHLARRGPRPRQVIAIELGPDTLARCRDVSPKFPFDSVTAYVEDKDQLAALVLCLNHESMRSRGVLLVGRADPRGSTAYNDDLGQRRADQIRVFLVGAGLAPSAS